MGLVVAVGLRFWIPAVMKLNFVLGADGSDSLQGTSAADSIVAMEGDDVVTSVGAGDVVRLGGGHDSLVIANVYRFASAKGGLGNDTIAVLGSAFSFATVAGGAGNDSISFGVAPTRSLIAGGQGADTINIDRSIRTTTVVGGLIDGIDDGSDTINIAGNVTNSYLSGNQGNDTLKIQGDVNKGAQISGGQDEDSLMINGDLSASKVLGGKGFDSLSLKSVLNATVLGGHALDANDDHGDQILISSLVEQGLVAGNGGRDTLSLGGVVHNSSISGGAGDDSLVLKDELLVARIRGGVGRDTIVVETENKNVQNSTIGGGLDSDSISIGALVHRSSVDGGTGSDTLNFAKLVLNSDIDAGIGHDSIRFAGLLFSSSVAGGIGQDTIVLESGQKDLFGTLINAGVDGEDVDRYPNTISLTFPGNIESSSVFGAAGADTLRIQAKADLINAELSAKAGNDSLAVEGRLDHASIFAGRGNDTLNYIYTGADNLVQSEIRLGAGEDYLLGGKTKLNGVLVSLDGEEGDEKDGNDTMDIEQLSGSTVYGRGGDDTIKAELILTSTVMAGKGEDTLLIGTLNDNINKNVSVAGGVGNDSLHVFLMEDGTIVGGAGNDTMKVRTPETGEFIPFERAKNVSVNGDEGDDKLEIGQGSTQTFNSATVAGAAGDDTIRFDAGGIKGSFSGGEGNDSIFLQPGFTQVFNESTATGGSGNDSLIFDGSPDAIDTEIRGGIGSDSLAVIDGDLQSSSLFGGQGNDTLYVKEVVKSQSVLFAGSSAESTGSGSNFIDLNKGITESTLYGEAGSDTIEISDGAGGYAVKTASLMSGAGADSITLAGSVYTAAVYAGAGDDTLYINGAVAAKTTVDAGAGSDYLDARDLFQSSTLIGGVGADTVSITGQVLNSVVSGHDDGDQFVFGNKLTSTSLIGGAGDDTFTFKSTFSAANATTYFFGSNDGSDTLIFETGMSSSNLQGTGFVMAFGGATNTTSQVSVSTGAAVTTVTYNGNTVYMQGFTSTGFSDANAAGMSFITISNDAITNLG